MKVTYTMRNSINGMPYNTGEQQAQLQEQSGVPFFTFPELEKIPGIRHGFSTRLGGVSEGYLASMNLSYSRGDDPDCVDENYKRMCQALGMRTEDLVLSDQVHDTVVYKAGRKDCQGENLRDKRLQGIDGLMTDEADVALCTSYADCVPLFFAEKQGKVIASSHSGWRGTVGKIGAKTVKALEQEYGVSPEQLTVVIGPSICLDCYEVSQDVRDAFTDFVSLEELERTQSADRARLQSMMDAVFLEKDNGKFQLDLWMANKLILMEAGVPEENISVSCVCTCCNSDLLYSHRASNGKRGNLNGFIQIMKKM